MTEVDPLDAVRWPLHAERLLLRRALPDDVDGRVIGDLMLPVEDAWAQDGVIERARGTQAELGWALDPAYGGQGYATEAGVSGDGPRASPVE